MSAMINFLLLLLLLVLAFYFLKTKKKLFIKPKFPPSPPKLPIIGNLHQLGKLPHQNLSKLSQQYGPLMLLHLGSIPTLVISSPNFAEQVLKTLDTTFCNRPNSPGPRRIFYNCSDVVFTSYGDHWRNVRKIFVSHILSARNDQAFFRAREIEVGNLIDYLSGAGPHPVNLDEKMFSLVGGVIGQVAFGKNYRVKKFEDHELKDVMDEAMSLIDSFSAEDFFPFFGWIVDYLTGQKARLDKCFHKLDGYLQAVLDEHLHRESQDEDEDLVDILIKLSNDNKDGARLSNEKIKAMFMNVFLGGVDTTAITLVWAMCELMRNPRVMHKVQEEIRVKLGVTPKIEGDNLGKFTYLKMVANETLRLHPPAPFLVPRESMSMCQLRGENGELYDVFPKTRVLINAWTIGRDPNSWDKPNEFYPERFERDDADFRGRHFQFLPFGSGRRICPGITNSITTIELTLANLLYWFNWEVPNGMNMEDVLSLDEEGGVTVHKRTHLTLVPVKYSWH